MANDVHGRETAFKLDDADGALQTLSAAGLGVRGLDGLPGSTERPNSDGFADDDTLYEVVGKSEGGPIALSGVWSRVAGTKIHGRQTRVLSDEFALSGPLRSANVSRSISLDNSDGFGDDWRLRGILGKRTGSVSFGGKFNSSAGSTDPVLRSYLRSATAAVMSIAPAGFAIGSLVEMLAACEGKYVVSSRHDQGPTPVSADFLANGRIDLGTALHDLTAETGVGTTNFTGVDEVEVTNLGGVAHLHVTAYSGWTNATIKVQDSADGSAWADLAGATFAVVTGVAKERIVLGATAAVRRHLRAVLTTTGASGSITFVVVFGRRGSSFGAAGTYRHLYELLGHANTQTFEYGPEGGASGKVKKSGEARMAKLDVSITHDQGPVEYSAELMVDGAVVDGIF